IDRRRMVAEELRELPGIATRLPPQDLEETGELVGIVAGPRHDLGTGEIGLLLDATRKLQEQRVQTEAAERRHDLGAARMGRAAGRWPSRSTSAWLAGSSTIGSCRSTWAADWRPISTSCSGVKRLKPGRRLV